LTAGLVPPTSSIALHCTVVHIVIEAIPLPLCGMLLAWLPEDQTRTARRLILQTLLTNEVRTRAAMPRLGGVTSAR
jgi:hypothetical protein